MFVKVVRKIEDYDLTIQLSWSRFALLLVGSHQCDIRALWSKTVRTSVDINNGHWAQYQYQYTKRCFLNARL